MFQACGFSETQSNSGIVDGKKVVDNVTLTDRFEKHIVAFELQDSLNGINEFCVLFTGSSSIRFWPDLEDDMKGINVLNRAFGESTIPEVEYYADRFLFKHKPKLIVFYCGENDIAEGASPEQVFLRFKKFFNYTNEKLPGVKWVYISMKPSVARWALWNKFKMGNELIQQYLRSFSNAKYMDCGTFMMDKNGVVRRDLFTEDGFQMNKLGYILWAKQLKPRIESLIDV